MRPTQKTLRTLTLAAVPALLLAASAEAGKLRKLEARFLGKAADKLGLAAEVRAQGKQILDRYDGQREPLLEQLSAKLKALAAAHDAPETGDQALDAQLEDLREHGRALRALRRKKRAELEGLLTPHQHLKVAAHIARKRDGSRRGRVEGLVRNMGPTVLQYVLGLEAAEAATVMQVFESRQPVRDALHAEGMEVRQALLDAAADPATSPERATQVVARAKVFVRKIQGTAEAALDELRTKLPARARAGVVVRIFKGVRAVLGMAGRFTDLAELGYFLDAPADG